MTQQFTASEVRDWERAYKGTGAAKVFGAFADLLEARQGMSLRDYFAAKAMQQYCSIAGLSDEQIATFAYATADAMLSARNKAHD